MTILSDDSLEFARAHITKYYDSDFFPKPREFDALWHCWDEVKAELKSKNIQKHWVTAPRIFPVPKPSGDFRVVHQLEPLDALIYTAIAYLVAGAVEAARQPIERQIACSYRLNINEGNFFSGGTGYGDFIEKTEELAARYEHVLVTDITDYYNQIYLHRLNNAIEAADAGLKPLADDLERFITALNGKPSQGIPVGPSASIVMAEATLIDVDQFIANHELEHTRYVDDFRVFSDSAEKLRRLQQDLTLYLYENHRLVLAGQKTQIHIAANYVAAQLHNPYAEERIQLFKSLEVFNPYTEDYEEFEVPLDAADEDAILIARLLHVIERVQEFDELDIGLARSAIRKARRSNIEELIEPVLDNLEFFSPVINDVALYLEELTPLIDIAELRPRLADYVESSLMDTHIVKFWLEWYLAGHETYLLDPRIREYINRRAHFVNRAKAAITMRDIAWVREQKNELYQLGSWDRRALLDSSRVLSGDERTHWLRLTEGSSPVLIDRWVARWVRETA